jgi:outer membrane lipoprotein LolB
MQIDGRARAAAWSALLVSILAACSTAPVTPPERSYTGRFSAITTAGEQRESVSGRFNFEIRGPQQRLELASPLGTTVARIEVDATGARATGAQMQEMRGPDADALAEQLLGWRLPVSGLSDWIEGRPVPERAARVERKNGRIVAIEQDGWLIQLPEAFEATTKPKRLVLERPSAPNTPAVTLRLIVDDSTG